MPNYKPGAEKEDEKQSGKWRTRSEMLSGEQTLLWHMSY